MKKEDCIFCKIGAGEIPSNTIYEDEKFRVILDLCPATKGHALIIPKEHYKNLYDLPDEMAADVIKLSKKMVIKITEKLGCDGFNILQNNNEVAGQSVMHYHMHIVPRYKNDNVYLAPKTTEPTQEELLEIKNIIIG